MENIFEVWTRECKTKRKISILLSFCAKRVSEKAGQRKFVVREIEGIKETTHTKCVQC